jgi:hypothetical protein
VLLGAPSGVIGEPLEVEELEEQDWDRKFMLQKKACGKKCGSDMCLLRLDFVK